MTEDATLPEPRMLVLEMTVAALVAQLPPASIEEVVGMLAYVAEASDGVDETVGTDSDLASVRFWADEMLNRVMVSRKPTRPATLDEEEAERRRYARRSAASGL